MVSRFEKIMIEGLFGSDEPIEIDFLDQKDPVKILYGVNGSGKTTILKIIQHSYCWNPVELFKLPFDSITYILNRRGDYTARTTLDYKPSRHNEEKNTETNKDNADELIRNFIEEIDKLFIEYDDYTEKILELEQERSQRHHRTSVDTRFDRGQIRISVDVKSKVKKNNLDKKQISMKLPQAKQEQKQVLHDIGKMMRSLPNILIKKFYELKDDNESVLDSEDPDDWLSSARKWDDGIKIDVGEKKVILKMNKEFDFKTKLTISKLTNQSEKIYFGYEHRWENLNVGNYLDIVEEKDPILEFSNPLINDLLKIIDKLHSFDDPSLSLEGLEWGFARLFEGIKNTSSIRMPDKYDYWENDWERIEKQLNEYKVVRYVDNPSQRKSVEDWIEVTINRTNEKIEIDDFLINHIDSNLVTHSKKGTRRIDEPKENMREFSHNMKAPELISELFDYQRKLISPSDRYSRNRKPDFYYVVPPKILNISTDRRNDDEYFNAFATAYNRVIEKCRKLVQSMNDEIKSGYSLDPSFDEESGALNIHNSDLLGELSRKHNLDLETFAETILQEIPGAVTNHDIDVNRLVYFLNNNRSGYESGQISTIQTAETIAAIVNFSEVIKLKRYLSTTFEDVKFNLEDFKIFTGKNEDCSIKFSDLSSGIRQKFRIITSVAMQVISSDKSLILIDEPEISLHLSWQRTFVDDLMEFLEDLTSKSRLRIDSEDTLENIISIIISTHSPAVLANHFHRGQKIGESDLFDE